MGRRRVVNLLRRDVVSLNRRRVVNFTGVCTLVFVHPRGWPQHFENGLDLEGGKQASLFGSDIGLMGFQPSHHRFAPYFVNAGQLLYIIRSYLDGSVILHTVRRSKGVYE